MNHDTLTGPTDKALSITGSIPVIDIGGLRTADDALQHEVAMQLQAACEAHGFFYICNHGISDELIARVFQVTQAFFAQEMAAKLQVDKSQSSCNRGYEPLRAQTLQDGAPPDLKESFYIGQEVAMNDPRVLAGLFNTGPNLWPTTVPSFRETTSEYFLAAHSLGGLIVRGLARSLDLPTDHFDAYLDNAAATLRLLHYPPQPGNPEPGEKGCGEHTDFGGVTLLLQDDVGGLQVRDVQQQAWVDAPSIPGTFVVNIGDLFARWTNGRYQSTLHRVVNASGRERHSVPFFFTGNLKHRVECLPTCIGPDETPKFSPVTVEGHLRECYRRTYA